MTNNEIEANVFRVLSIKLVCVCGGEGGGVCVLFGVLTVKNIIIPIYIYIYIYIYSSF